MAVSKSANTYNRQNWEESEFPILCQTCLGDNPYIRMLKEKYGKECKICQRPFTVFKWCPGARMRYKKTEICQTCSKIKNVCQTCLLDLEYGLPVQVRDTALAIKDEMPKSDVNKEFYTQNIDKELANTDGTSAGGAVGKSQGASDLLMKLARTAPYYKRNRPHICSFWVKGECKRGEECPFRHEMPTDPNDPLASQNIKDRFYGSSDPVADKLLKRAAAMPKLDPPTDKTVMTLYIGGLDGRITDQDLRDHFYQFGEIRQVTMVSRQNCAFVTFTSRPAAETAAERSFNKLILKGRRLKILWGKSQAEKPKAGKEGGVEVTPVPGLPGALPKPPIHFTKGSEGGQSQVRDSSSSDQENSTSSNLPEPPALPQMPPPPRLPILPFPLPHVGPGPDPRFPPPRIPPPPPRGLPPPNLPPHFYSHPAGGPPRGPPRGPPPRGPPPGGPHPRGPPPGGPHPGGPHPRGPPHGHPPNMPPPPPRHPIPPRGIHYPSQDPMRMGAEGYE